MKTILSMLVSLCFTLTSFADVSLPRIFSANMVLQRNQSIPVWGWASPGEKITVSFNKQTVKTKAGKDGKWKVALKQEAAGGPYSLTVKGKNQIVVDNVLVGEVWLCSGQSNMEMHVEHSSDKRYVPDMKAANNAMIRHIKIQTAVSDTLSADIAGGEWKLGNDSNTVREFSSVGYFFALKLYEQLKVPVGLINSTWGGTVVETWTSREALDSAEDFKGSVKTTYAAVKSASKNGQVWPNNYPSLLFNAMINPIIPYAIKGALWYQGESNAGRASQYKKAFPLMINDWRARWKQGDFPFYFVQLASWQATMGNSAKGSTWAELREAQTATLALPNTGMAVTLDIGDTKDIHPANKKDVGLRLAAIALDKLYDKHGEYSGPVFKSMAADGNKAVLSFTHADGLWVKDNYGYLKGFEVAGADQKFYYAKADIKDGKVIVYSDSVSAPVAVRYGWADDMPEANLYNKAGFPAVPFRTDKWKGITENEKYLIQ
jgi:sialate O-acetylesterase